MEIDWLAVQFWEAESLNGESPRWRAARSHCPKSGQFDAASNAEGRDFVSAHDRVAVAFVILE